MTRIRDKQLNTDEVNTGTKEIADAVNELLNNILSSGYVSGGAITDNLDGTVDVAAGIGYIRQANSDTATLQYTTWDAVTNVTMTDGASTYIYLDYFSGTPAIKITTDGASIRNNENDKFELYEVVREGTTLHITDHRQYANNAIRRNQQRIYSINRIERANAEGGLILGETGTRNITVTSGKVWIKLDFSIISAIDTSGSDTFDRYYRDGVGGWTKQSGQAQWDNANYDDGSGTLAPLTVNRYTAQYFYIETDGSLVSLYGQAQYVTIGQAEADVPPSNVPLRVEEHALLIGRLIIQQGASTATSIESTFTTIFSAAAVSDHGQLAGLADDDHLQYLLLSGRSGQTITDDIDITGSLDVDNININGNTLSSTNTDGNINIDPNGSGATIVNSAMNVQTLNFSGATISTVTGNLILAPNNADVEKGNILIGDNGISVTTTNDDLLLLKNGIGRVEIGDSGFSSSFSAGTIIGGTYSSVFYWNTSDSSYPIKAEQYNTHDNIIEAYDCWFDSVNYRSADIGSNFLFLKQSDKFKIQYDAGVAVGNNLSLKDGITIDSATGYVSINGDTPSGQLNIENTSDGVGAINVDRSDSAGTLLSIQPNQYVQTSGTPGILLFSNNRKFGISSAASVASSNDLSIWIAQTGEVNFPKQPCFLAFVNTEKNDVIGGSANWTVQYDAERFDLNGDYNTGTYTLTAPVSGKYFLQAGIGLFGISAAHTQGRLEIVTSNATYRLSRINLAAVYEAGATVITGSCIVDMDQGDTAFVRMYANSTVTVDVNAGVPSGSFFSGKLMA